MKEVKENIPVVPMIILVLSLVFLIVTVGLSDTTTSNHPTHTEEVQTQATVTYVLKMQQYVPSAHQMLHTVRYDITVDGTTKTCVQTSYTVFPNAWQLEEGDVVECTLVITYDSEGNVVSKEIK